MFHPLHDRAKAQVVRDRDCYASLAGAPGKTRRQVWIVTERLLHQRRLAGDDRRAEIVKMKAIRRGDHQRIRFGEQRAAVQQPAPEFGLKLRGSGRRRIVADNFAAEPQKVARMARADRTEAQNTDAERAHVRVSCPAAKRARYTPSIRAPSQT